MDIHRNGSHDLGDQPGACERHLFFSYIYFDIHVYIYMMMIYDDIWWYMIIIFLMFPHFFMIFMGIWCMYQLLLDIATPPSQGDERILRWISTGRTTTTTAGLPNPGLTGATLTYRGPREPMINHDDKGMAMYGIIIMINDWWWIMKLIIVNIPINDHSCGYSQWG